MPTGMKLSILFNKVNVNTIDTASGIFFGTNCANGWSSHSKNNYGFGTASDNSYIDKNINVIYDNDMIDSPIDDRDTIVSNKQSGHGDHKIDFNEINVNALDTNATISVGDNSQNGWDTHSKNNFGQGTFYGNNLAPNNKNFISDNDLIDTPINDQDYKPSFYSKRE
jgi:hypothetical protein